MLVRVFLYELFFITISNKFLSHMIYAYIICFLTLNTIKKSCHYILFFKCKVLILQVSLVNKDDNIHIGNFCYKFHNDQTSLSCLISNDKNKRFNPMPPHYLQRIWLFLRCRNPNFKKASHLNIYFFTVCQV